MLQPIPVNAWVAVFPPAGATQRAAADQVAADKRVRWSGPYLPEWKIDPELTGGPTRGKKASSPSPQSTQSTSSTPLARRSPPGEVGSTAPSILRVDLLAFDTGAATPLAKTIESLGGHIIRSGRIENQIRVTLDVSPDAVPQLAALNAVVWVQKWHEPKKRGERAAQVTAGNLTPEGSCATGGGTYATWLGSLGLGGDGLIVQVMDDGLSKGIATNEPDTAHPDILGRIAGIDNATSDATGDGGAGHGHINASIIMGQPKVTGQTIADADGFLFGQGVAPDAWVWATKIFTNSGPFDIGSQTFTDLAARASRGGAVLSSNSWGTDSYGDYDIDSQEFDALTRDADPSTAGYQPVVFVFAAGNAGPDAGSIGSPATGKNVISVGAGENCDAGPGDGCGVLAGMSNDVRDIADFSSRGPTADLRFGPTVFAPGTHIMGAASDASGFDGSGVCGASTNNSIYPPTDAYYPPGQTAYTWSSGTSHSTPVVAGASILFMEYYRNSTGSLPSPAMVRAALVNGAVDCAGGSDNDAATLGPVPDNKQGWGRVNLSSLVNPDRGFVFVDQTHTFTAAGQIYEKRVQVVDSTRPLRVTLAWSDTPALPAATKTLINDLDLRVVHQSDTWLGNVFENGQSILGGAADRLNSSECVYIENPSSGFYTIQVSAAALGGDALPLTGGSLEQDFALVASNAYDQTSRGLVAIDRGLYRCADQVAIAVSDADLRGSGTVTVVARTLPTGDREDVTLTESPADSGEFSGSIDITGNPPVSGNGALEGVEGDTLEVAYSDADNGTGIPATSIDAAELDCTAPALVIRDVFAVTDHSARLRITCGESARAVLEYGASCLSLNNRLESNLLNTEHLFDLDSLTPCSTTYHRVTLIDAAGNAAVFGGAGDCFTFVTAARTDLASDDLEPAASLPWTHFHAIGVDDWAVVVSAQAHSPTHAWFAADVDGSKDAFLISPPVDLPANSRLGFWHTYEFESFLDEGYDGAVLEISTNGGSTWQDLGDHIVVGPYTTQISDLYGSPIPGRWAWSGGTIGAMTPVEVDLSPFAGTARRVRWRIACDGSVDAVGWYIDDVAFWTNLPCVGQTAQVFANPSLIQGTGSVVVEVIDSGLVAAGSVDVSLRLLRTGESTPLTLTNKHIPAGGFLRTIPVDDQGYSSISVNNGALIARHGDVIQVEYPDPDRGDGLPGIASDAFTIESTAPSPTPTATPIPSPTGPIPRAWLLR